MRTTIAWDFLVENGIATDGEVRLVACINGQSMETMYDILYAKEGLRSWYQCLEYYNVPSALLEYEGYDEEEDD